MVTVLAPYCSTSTSTFKFNVFFMKINSNFSPHENLNCHYIPVYRFQFVGDAADVTNVL